MEIKETFNKNKLINLIKKAQSNLTQNEFSKRCKISSSNLTRIYKGDQRPSPDLLKKIADNAVEATPYEKLMIAAGYWKEAEHFDLLPVKNIFNYRLKSLRENLGYTVDELAENANVPVEMILAFEDNTPTNFSRLDLINISKVFEVNADYLTGESAYKTEEEEKAAFQTLEVLEENLEKMGDDFSKKILLQINRILNTLSVYEQGDGNISLPSFKYSIIKSLKILRKICDNNLEYTNLYGDYNFYHRDGKILTHDDIYKLDDMNRIEVYGSAISKHDHITLWTIENLDEMRKLFADYGESTVKEYYREAYDIFLNNKDEDYEDDMYDE